MKLILNSPSGERRRSRRTLFNDKAEVPPDIFPVHEALTSSGVLPAAPENRPKTSAIDSTRLRNLDGVRGEASLIIRTLFESIPSVQ